MTIEAGEPQVLTVAEAGTALGVSRATAYRYVEAGLLKLVPLPGRKRVVARSVTALKRRQQSAGRSAT